MSVLKVDSSRITDNKLDGIKNLSFIVEQRFLNLIFKYDIIVFVNLCFDSFLYLV